ncbi:MAG: nitroreductase family protein [Candidatus Methanomethylophilaceae archaeon]|nr:nitroreductase family protein [Candidatus Methanomethylophilaceae archaeon]
MCNDTDFLEIMEKRYSVRSYSDKPVEKQKLDRILRAAQIAPTAVNKQPQRIYVLQSEEALKKAAQVTRFTFGAPLILLVCSDTKVGHVMADGQYIGTVDVAIAMTQMMLEATELGLGTCWVRGFVRGDVSKVFGLPDNILPEGMLIVGYPSDDSVPGRFHSDRIPIDDMVTYL